MEIIVENIKYQLDTIKKTAKVSGWLNDPIEKIIPEYVEYEYEKYKVTEIGYYALSGCSSLTSITIPNSVTIIEDSAFCLCKSLKSITIPNSVTSIGILAFSNCSGLTSVTIGNSITKIGEGAFAYCTSLTSVNIPNSVTYIGNMAFALCKSLTSINIPDSVTFIGNNAFLNSPLKEVRIPKNCTEFYGCSFKETVNVIIDENNPYYFKYQNFIFKFIDTKNVSLIRYQGDDCEVQIPEIVNYKEKDYKVIEIGEYVFNGCENLISINIPNSVTKICLFAFTHCSSLTSVTIPDSVTYIGQYAFTYCSSLITIDIPDSVTFIGDGVFFNCENLESIDIPDSVTFIGKSAFDKIGLTLPKKYTEDGRLIAYKAFTADMTCRKFQYEEGKTYEIEGKIKCCFRGFHACTDLLDIFNYYSGEIGKDIYIHEVYLSGDIDEFNGDSKVCASKIEIGRRLSVNNINEIINNK